MPRRQSFLTQAAHLEHLDLQISLKVGSRHEERELQGTPSGAAHLENHCERDMRGHPPQSPALFPENPQKPVCMEPVAQKVQILKQAQSTFAHWSEPKTQRKA